MPRGRRLGRGRDAAWTTFAIRRAEYLARLRSRGVNGQVLPLLAFVADGWGWPEVLPRLQLAAKKGWEIDRRSLTRRGRVKTQRDLMLNVDTGAPDDSPLDWRGALLPAREAVVTGVWFGAPADDRSVVPFARALAHLIPGLSASPVDDGLIVELGAKIEGRRRARPLSAAEVPAWLETLSASDITRGWLVLHGLLLGFRRILRALGQQSANPLNLYGESPAAVAAFLRRQTGRPSASLALGGVIVQAMYLANYIEDAEIPEIPLFRRARAPSFDIKAPAGSATEP